MSETDLDRVYFSINRKVGLINTYIICNQPLSVIFSILSKTHQFCSAFFRRAVNHKSIYIISILLRWLVLDKTFLS